MRSPVAILALLALVVGAGRAMAAPFAAPLPPASVVPAGATVVTTVPALPRGAEEFELFLLPESGAPIRVSAELPAGTTRVRWRMPAVAARHARLLLRAGGEHVEWESAPSASFALAGLGADELPRLLGGRSEAGAHIESSAGSAAAGLCASPRAPVLAAAGTPAFVAEPSPAPIAAPAENSGLRAAAAPRGTRPASALHARTNTPAFRPLRN